MRHIRSVVLLMYLGIASAVPLAAQGQTDITLRFLDAESGKPITNLSVDVSAWDKNRGEQKPEPDGIVRIDKNTQLITTDKDGKALFHFNDQPSLITVYIDTVGDLHGCSDHEFTIKQIMGSGVVANYHARLKWCPPLRAHATAAPGQIVIFDKRLTKFDRMRQEIP